MRGAWLGFAAGCAACTLGLRRRWLVLAALVLVLAGALAVEPRLLERVKTVGSLADDTTRDRLAMLDAGLGLAIAHPLTGIGPGQVKNVYPTVASPEALRRSTSHLHNTPLQIVVERGLPGLAAWIAIWVGYFGAAWRVFRRVPSANRRGPEYAGAGPAIAAHRGVPRRRTLRVQLRRHGGAAGGSALMALPFVVERELTLEAAESAQLRE